MNLLLLLGRVPVPAECERSSIDSDWLLRLAEHHQLVVAVDEDSPGARALRDAGLTVHVSDKRHVHLPGGELADADEALARWVTARHTERPLDLVVAGADRPLFGGVRAALPDVPWAVAAATGPGALAARLGLDDDWVGRHGHELWYAASNVAAADAVVTPVAPAALGIHAPGTTVRTLLPVPEPELRQRVRGELVVVAATGVSPADATATAEAAIARIDVRASTTVVVLHTPPVAGSTDVAAGLAAGVPAAHEQQVVLVPTGRHGEAGDWLDAAEALVLADASELLVPSLARRASVLPTVLLGEGRQARTRVTELLSAPPQPAEPAPVALLPWSNAPAIARELRTLRRDETPGMVVLHTEGGIEEANRWLGLDGLTRYDVVVGATGRLPWSMPRLDRLDGGVVALRRRSWNAVADVLDDTATLPDLVRRLSCLAGAASHTLGVVTVDHTPTEVVRPAVGHPPLRLAGGPLPSLRPPSAAPPEPSPARRTTASGGTDTPADDTTTGLRDWVRTTRWTGRARLALPWRLGLGEAIRDGEFPAEVATWAKQHDITDRARLLLPWKWGLLPRAMEDRW